MFVVQFCFGTACCLYLADRDETDASARKLGHHLNSHLGATTKTRHWNLGLKWLTDSGRSSEDRVDDVDFHRRKVFVSEDAYRQRFSQVFRMPPQGHPV